MEKFFQPKFRQDLKAVIIGSGYPNVREFCQRNGIDETVMSRILRGWQIPSPRIQKILLNSLKLECLEGIL